MNLSRDALLLNPKEQYQEAFRLLQAGEILQAEHCLRPLMDAYPDHPDVLHLLGVVLKDSGRLEEAVARLRTAVDKCPENARIHYHYGLALAESAVFDKAIDAFAKAITIDPDFHDARYNLAKVLKDCGDLETSAQIYQELIEIQPDHVESTYNLANIYYEQDRDQEAIRLYNKILSLNPFHHNARTNLALIKSKQENLPEAIEDLEKVLDVEPDHRDAKLLHRRLNSTLMPAWHFDMLNDTARNDAYNQAITRAAANAQHVLEIGTGSGLLAMMAARAGAQKVTTCEMSTPLSKVASKIIRKNGFADRIRIINKKSTRLQVGKDLSEPADVLIAEVFDVGLLGEHFLPALRHARHNLLYEDAIIVPASARISALLIECPELRRINPIKQIAGFDLSDFNIFKPPGYAQFDLKNDAYNALSNPFEACCIDFQKDNFIHSGQTLSVVPNADGICDAIVFWFDIHLDSETIITSSCDSQTNHWKQAIQFFEKDLKIFAGRPLNLSVNLSQTGLSFQLEPEGSQFDIVN